MLKRVIVPGTVLLALILGLTACGGGTAATATPASRPTAATSTAPSGGGMEIVVSLTEHAFSPKEIKVKAGTPITFKLDASAAKELHTFTVDDLGINQMVLAGATEIITITPSTAGSFKLYCVPHESQGMTATFIVE